jgi:hypothetical protein
MLIFFYPKHIQLYANYPSAPPWAAQKTAHGGYWQRNLGGGLFELSQLMETVAAYRSEQAVALAAGNAPVFKCAPEAYAKFLDTIDPVHQHMLARFSHNTFHLYNAVRRCPGLFELMSEHGKTPELAGAAAVGFALANLVMFRQPKLSHPLRSARSLLKRRRRDIAVWLGFPREHAAMAVRIMGRIPTRELGVPMLHELRTALQRDDAHARKLLAHAGRINQAASLFVEQPSIARWVTPALFDELSRRDDWPGGPWQLQRMAIDTLELVRTRGMQMPMVRSVEELTALHATEIEGARRRPVPYAGQRDVFAVSLPPQPLADLPGEIEYLPTTAALADEGAFMINCVGGYGARVARNECFIYRVLAPERCTLAIHLGYDDAFHIREIKGPRNAPITNPATLRFVERWLRNNHDARAVARVREELARSETYTPRHSVWAQEPWEEQHAELC